MCNSTHRIGCRSVQQIFATWIIKAMCTSTDKWVLKLFQNFFGVLHWLYQGKYSKTFSHSKRIRSNCIAGNTLPAICGLSGATRDQVRTNGWLLWTRTDLPATQKEHFVTRWKTISLSRSSATRCQLHILLAAWWYNTTSVFETYQHKGPTLLSDVTERGMVLGYRRFGITYHSHLHAPRSPRRKPRILAKPTYNLQFCKLTSSQRIPCPSTRR